MRVADSSNAALKRENEELERAKIEAERANEGKTEFISRMSRELRTPLNALLGSAQLLEMDELTPRQQENVDLMITAGRHLLDLLDEILDITQIETGELSLSLEPVPLRPVASEALSLIQPLADERGVLISTEIGDETVLADRRRLKQVLLNLLSNAVTYNHRGGAVRVSTALDADAVSIDVADTGRGISQDLVTRLFDPFERRGVDFLQAGGAGLGLALSKRLTQMMGGRLSVESSPGVGSTFSVELRLAEELHEATEVGVAEQLQAPASGHACTVVYIEDSLSNLKLVERALERRPQVTLLPAGHGVLGLEIAREHRPDLVLLDLELPDIQGSEVLALLQADPLTSAIPVVILSSEARNGEVKRLLAQGAVDYLTKPIDVRRFLEVLGENLWGQRKVRAS